MEIWNTFAKKFEEIGNPEQPWKPAPSMDEIHAFEQKVGVSFPPELVEYLSACDRPMITLCAPWTLMPLSFITNNWDTQKALADTHAGQEPPNTTKEETRDHTIKPDWYNLKWIPLLDSGGGDLHCVDLDPAEGGTAGQVISYFHDKDDRHVLAKSLTDYFEKILAEINAGNLGPAGAGEDGLVAKEGSEAARIFFW